MLIQHHLSNPPFQYKTNQQVGWLKLGEQLQKKENSKEDCKNFILLQI